MILPLLRIFLLASLTYASLACSGTAKPLAEPVTTAESSNAKAIDKIADDLVLAARQEEPAVTLVLQELAREAGGELVGLKHRLKERPSMIRKIHLLKGDRPIEEVIINDALRYTMRVEDDPEGAHVETIVRVVVALEAKGHRVIMLKNYWPKGDSYSGVNSVLESSSGLQWELQFHTADSLRVQKITRGPYEEFREVTTTVERKRELFDHMSSVWDQVKVPHDVLKPENLHSTEQIIHRPRP